MCCFCRATGREVIFLGGNNDFIGEDGNAYTLQGRAKDGVIYVNPNNGTYISNQVLAEEFIHSIEGTESYTEFVTFVSDLAKNDPLIDVGAEKAEIKRIYDGAGVKYNLEREFTAQMAAKLLFNDAESVESLVKNRQSVAGRFFDFLSHYSAKLTGNDEKATVLQARRLLSQALRESEEREGESGNITAEEVRYSLSKAEDYKDILNRIETMDEAEAKWYKEHIPFIRIADTTPQLLIDECDCDNLPLIMQFHSLYLETRESGVLEGNYHNLGAEVMGDIYNYLNNADLILEGTNGRYMVVTQVPSRKTGHAIISVEINSIKNLEDEFKYYNVIITAFDLKKNYIKNLHSKGQIKRIVYEKEALSQVNPQLHEWLDIINEKASDTMISQNEESVNTYSMQDGGSYSIARKSGATMEQAQKLFNDLTYNGELTDAEKLREIYKKDPSLFGMLRDVVEGERTIAEEGNLDYAAPYDEALFVMGLVEDSKGYTSEEVAESIDAAGWQVEDINKDGLLFDAEYAVNCSENAHDVCGEIVRGINRLVPGAFGYSAEEISEIKSIWQRAYDDPAGFSAELEAKKAEELELEKGPEEIAWNIPENGETVSERAVTSAEKTLERYRKQEGIAEGFFGDSSEGEKQPLSQAEPDSSPYTGEPLDGEAKSIDEVTAEMTAEHREMLKTKSKADFDALKGTEKLKAAGVTGITGSVGLYGHTEQAIEQKQGRKETQKAIREVERVLSPDEIKFAKLVNRGEIDAKYIPESLRRELILDLAEMYKAQDGFKAAKKLINKSLSAFYLAYKCTCGNQFFLNK